MFGDPIANPKGWPILPFKETCHLTTGNTPSRKIPEYYGDFLEWIKSDNITSTNLYLSRAVESLSEKGAKLGRIVEPGALLMTCIAGSLNTIGNIAIANRRVAFNQQITAFVPLKYESLFLYYLLIQIRSKLHEVTNITLKCILNKSTLDSFVAIVPPRELQLEFAKLVEQTDKSKFTFQIAIYRDVWGPN